MTIKAIVFDLDGTLYQEDRLGEEVNRSAIHYVADLKGITPPEAEALLEATRAADDVGGTLSRAVVALGGTLQELHKRFAADCHPERLLKPDHRVRELLQLLSTRFQLHLYTNNNRDLSGRIMRQIGVDDLLDRVFTIEDYWIPKPDRRIIEDILAKIGCRAQETLFVGDRYRVDLAVPESMGCSVFEMKTTEDLLTLADLVH
ncbi:HAD family hydrolase [Geomonas paludis]|uniref:phosphoglycolate phosphatase n=1 Tax=Geomonas paludis TaxID=2740185 RepID=A0A6V8MY00_9BACT|nr:HAD family hydrolase [Geomonas paludis]UPU34588.1 HAD family hydrolase [Geomonas paludis]GFO64960.1 haloacid dehalogenase [Geomonas paludis]